MLQRSNEWYNARLGRFTASEADRLLGSLGDKRTKEKIQSFAIEKASEMYFGIDEEDAYISKDMERGITLEPLAFKKFKSEKQLDFIDVVECGFFKYGKHAGASPDALCSNNFNTEFKAPTLKTFNQLIKTKEINPKYYAQMQFQMLCNDAKGCYFYNYILHKGNEYSFELVVERDEPMIELFKERILYAAEIKEQHYLNLVNLFG